MAKTRKTLKGKSVGFIGLGLMGRPMCRNLKAAGAKLVVWNRSPGPAKALQGPGVTAAATPAEVARRAPVVILMLADTKAVQQVLFGRQGAAKGVGKGSLVIDMGTTAVSETRAFAARLAQAGCAYVDAPVSGGEVGAKAATLSIMAGGARGAMARARPILETLGRRITHVGEVGAGQVAKAANQVIVGLTIGAVAEALALARAAGVDPARVREALQGGFADSRVLELHGARMIKRDFRPGGRARIQRKDMAQALALARELGLDLPATRLNRRLYDRLIAAGSGDLDHSALSKLYED